MQFARGCEFTTKNKKLKTWGGKLCAIKKIVRDPSVLFGPLPSALPPPLGLNALCPGGRWPRSHWVIWVIWVIVFMSHGWRQHGHGLGHLGHCFLRDLSDLKTRCMRAPGA